MTGLFDDLAGSSVADPRVAQGLVRRVVGRIQRMVDRGVLPSDSIEAQIVQVRDTANEKAELAQRIGEALQAGDRTRAQRLIEIGGEMYGLAAMAAAVEAQARESRLAALKAQQDQWADQWPYDEDPAPAYLDDEEWFDGSR